MKTLDQTVSLRPATLSDGPRLFEWANDPTVRSNAFSSTPISWEDHVRWLGRKFGDPDCRIFVAVDASGEPVGQIRFDGCGQNGAEVHVAVAPHHRSRRYGSQIIASGVTLLFEATTAQEVHAYVLPHNVASMRAFEAAGFTKLGTEPIRGRDALHYVRNRADGA